MNYLVSKEIPKRLGNSHPNVTPYDVVECSDGFFILAVGNDRQFNSCCKALNRLDLSSNEKFKTNAQRIKHRDELKSILANVILSFL